MSEPEWEYRLRWTRGWGTEGEACSLDLDELKQHRTRIMEPAYNITGVELQRREIKPWEEFEDEP